MNKKPKFYTAEFKAEVIKSIEENKSNVSERARQLGIAMQTHNKAKAGTLEGTQQYPPDTVALLEVNKKLKKQLKAAEMKKEFLQKQQRTLPRKVSEVRIYETIQKYIPCRHDG